MNLYKFNINEKHIGITSQMGIEGKNTNGRYRVKEYRHR